MQIRRRDIEIDGVSAKGSRPVREIDRDGDLNRLSQSRETGSRIRQQFGARLQNAKLALERTLPLIKGFEDLGGVQSSISGVHHPFERTTGDLVRGICRQTPTERA